MRALDKVHTPSQILVQIITPVWRQLQLLGDLPEAYAAPTGVRDTIPVHEIGFANWGKNLKFREPRSKLCELRFRSSESLNLANPIKKFVWGNIDAINVLACLTAPDATVSFDSPHKYD